MQIMKYFVLLLTRVKLIVNIEWEMIFKFADSISVGMELQTISPKLSLINPDLLKQSHSNTLYSSLANKCSLKVVLSFLAILSICKSKASGRRSMVIGNFGLGLDLQRCHAIFLKFQNFLLIIILSFISSKFVDTNVNHVMNSSPNIYDEQTVTSSPKTSRYRDFFSLF